jgi:hypothetical protein
VIHSSRKFPSARSTSQLLLAAGAAAAVKSEDCPCMLLAQLPAPRERESFPGSPANNIATCLLQLLIETAMGSEIHRKFLDTLGIGQRLRAKDRRGSWYTATVLDMRQHTKEVHVHFKGWHERYDEWVPLSRACLTPEKPGEGGDGSEDDGTDDASTKTLKGGAEYEVERILGRRSVGGVVQYRVRWKGYRADDDTWEPSAHLSSAEALVQMYEAKRAHGSPKSPCERAASKRPPNTGSTRASDSLERMLSAGANVHAVTAAQVQRRQHTQAEGSSPRAQKGRKGSKGGRAPCSKPSTSPPLPPRSGSQPGQQCSEERWSQNKHTPTTQATTKPAAAAILQQDAAGAFACMTCGKCFATAQKLGGHRRHGCATRSADKVRNTRMRGGQGEFLPDRLTWNEFQKYFPGVNPQMAASKWAAYKAAERDSQAPVSRPYAVGRSVASCNQATAAATSFTVGDRVEGLYSDQQGQAYYDATVAAVHEGPGGSISYTLDWDDGDPTRRRQPARNVRRSGTCGMWLPPPPPQRGQQKQTPHSDSLSKLKVVDSFAHADSNQPGDRAQISGVPFTSWIGAEQWDKGTERPVTVQGKVPLPRLYEVMDNAAYARRLGGTAFKKPDAYIRATRTPQNFGCGLGMPVSSSPEARQIRQWRGVDYECDAADETWLRRQAERAAGTGARTSIRQADTGGQLTPGRLEELIDFFEKSHYRLAWVSPVGFATWCDRVLDGRRDTEHVGGAALKLAYEWWEVKRRGAGRPLVRSVLAATRPARASRQACPKYTEALNEREFEDMLQNGQTPASTSQSRRGPSWQGVGQRSSSTAQTMDRLLHQLGRQQFEECMAVPIVVHELVEAVMRQQYAAMPLPEGVTTSGSGVPGPLSCTHYAAWVQQRKRSWQVDRQRRRRRKAAKALELRLCKSVPQQHTPLTNDMAVATQMKGCGPPRPTPSTVDAKRAVPTSSVDIFALLEDEGVRSDWINFVVACATAVGRSSKNIQYQYVTPAAVRAQLSTLGSSGVHQLLHISKQVATRKGSEHDLDTVEGILTPAVQALSGVSNLAGARAALSAVMGALMRQLGGQTVHARLKATVSSTTQLVANRVAPGHAFVAAELYRRLALPCPAARKSSCQSGGNWSAQDNSGTQLAAGQGQAHCADVTIWPNQYRDSVTDMDSSTCRACQGRHVAHTCARQKSARGYKRRDTSEPFSHQAWPNKRRSINESSGRPMSLQRARSMAAVEAERQRGGHGYGIAVWETDPGQDPTEYVGKSVRDYFYKVVSKEDETPAVIAQSLCIDTAAFVSYNQRRWYPQLTESSKLRGGTHLLVPTQTTGVGSVNEKHGVEGVVSATNYLHWRIDFESGERVEVDEVDVRRAFWQHRCHAEGWQTAAGAGGDYVGRRIRLERGVNASLGAAHVHATCVAYLPQGEDVDDFELWHVIHDDGDDEDLERHEIEPALKAWQQAQLSDLKDKYGRTALAQARMEMATEHTPVLGEMDRALDGNDGASSDDSLDIND